MIEAIKQLRTRTGCGMMDCKKALSETNGDLEAAILWLREHGMSKAAKKSDRETTEGAVGVITDGNWGAVLQVACETDFVARNDQFQQVIQKLLEVVKNKKIATLDALLATEIEPGLSVEEHVKALVGVVGESLRLIDLKTLQVDQGIIGSYVHNAYSASTGKIGVIVAVSSKKPLAEISDLGEPLAMHVAASAPLAVRREDLDSDVVNQERHIFEEEARNSGKPEAALDKIVQGRLEKFFKETVMEAQPYIMADSKTVGTFLKEKGAVLDAFAMMKVG